MCILSLYFRVFEGYPLVVAANRDEFFFRPAAPPGFLSEHPAIFGGRDLQAGGTWLGVNQHGLLVGVLNRRLENAGASPDRRSRGRLCLDALGAATADEALAMVRREAADSYRPFNLLIASAASSFVAFNLDDRIEAIGLDPGLHVLSNTSVFDPRSEKMNTAFGLFGDVARRARTDIPGFFGDGEEPHPPCLESFRAVLASHRVADGTGDPRGAICVHADPYGTVSSSVIVLAQRQRRFLYYHAPSAPCRAGFSRSAALEIR